MRKYINRDLKGTYRYIRKQLTFEIVKTVILFIMALGIFFIGYMTLHTKKSLWSVLAVLALLPACRSLVGVIMLARFSSLGADEYERFSSFTDGLPVLFESIFTTSSQTFYIPVLVYKSGCVIAYYPKKVSTGVLKDHLDAVLKTGGHKVTLKIFEDEASFAKRCNELKDKSADNTDKAASSVIDTLKAVSL